MLQTKIEMQCSVIHNVVAIDSNAGVDAFVADTYMYVCMYVRSILSDPFVKLNIYLILTYFIREWQ